MFAGGSYVLKSPIAHVQRTVNLFPELMQEVPSVKARAILLPTPGFTQYGATLAYGAWRGAFTTAGRSFGAVGTRLVEIASGGGDTDRGTIDHTDTTPVTFAANGAGGDQIFFAASGKGYCYDLSTNTLTEELSSGVTMVAALDGFFIALNATTSTIRISESFDGTTWDATQIYQRTAAGDKWVSLLVSDLYIWLLGELTSEAFYNDGGSPFPFAPNTTILPYGTPAPHSAADAGGSVLFLAQNADGLQGVMKTEGLSARKVSTLALDVAIKGYATISDAIGESYTEEGHTFYELNFPTVGKTWVFDLTTGLWHERGYWNSELNAYEALKPFFHMYNFGKHLVGDRTTGKLWEMSTDIATDVDGEGIRRLRRVPSVFYENHTLFYTSVELLLESGLGVLGQDEPLVELNFANDGGKNFDNAGFVSAGTRAAGAEGEYLKRVRWTNLGSGRQRVWEFVMSEATPWRLINAFEAFTLGRSARR